MVKVVFILLLVSAIGSVAFGEEASIHEQLAASREQIDKVDRQIVDLLNQRAAVVEKIGKIKAAAGLFVSVPHREQEVLGRVAEIGSAGPLPTTVLASQAAISLENTSLYRDLEEREAKIRRLVGTTDDAEDF